jgi:ferric-dicitrate binding protein FerR (iron transport regulator)
MEIDVMAEPELEPDERPVRFTRRRMIRWALILTIGILVVLASWQEPLHAGR